MIPTKTRESRRLKTPKLPKNLERLFKEGKCRECAVVITRMDFAKILGKFTKVKIQYESSTTSNKKKGVEATSPNSRLKSNENGMVLIHRNAYSKHPVKELLSPKKDKNNETDIAKNILKENNRLKKYQPKDNKTKSDSKKQNHSNLKSYGIIFEDPMAIDNNNNDKSSNTSLSDLLPYIDKTILPSEEWCIDFFPKLDEPKDDKVYDRIAAELEDLMYSEKPATKPDDKPETKSDDFPSIMDILNDNSNENKVSDQSAPAFKTNLESSDVEAMLLGKTNTNDTLPTPMEVDSTVIGNLIEDVSQLNAIHDTIAPVEDKLLPTSLTTDIDNPNSPSILDEALQKGIEEHLPAVSVDTPKESSNNTTDITEVAVEKTATKAEEETKANVEDAKPEESTTVDKVKEKPNAKVESQESVTHVVFKKSRNGTCYKSVMCPKNLKYGIELEGKSVEFLGAPKFVSSLEDLQVLLEIVHESELSSLYVLQ